MNSISIALIAVSSTLGACSRSPPAPPVADRLEVSIDAANNCSMSAKAVDCRDVANLIHAQYPTSKPRVDICLDRQTRFEAAAEVMKSVADAGFAVGTLDCKKS